MSATQKAKRIPGSSDLLIEFECICGKKHKMRINPMKAIYKKFCWGCFDVIELKFDAWKK